MKITGLHHMQKEECCYPEKIEPRRLGHFFSAIFHP